MAQLTLQQAATQVGKSRSTIWRAVKSGRISAHKQEDGDFLVDASELLRVYPPVVHETSHDTHHETSRNDSEINLLRLELTQARELLTAKNEQVAALQADKADLRAERDKLLDVVQA